MPLVRKSSLKHQLSELINDQNQKTQNIPLWKSKTQKIMQNIPQNNHHRNLTQTPTSAKPISDTFKTTQFWRQNLFKTQSESKTSIYVALSMKIV